MSEKMNKLYSAQKQYLMEKYYVLEHFGLIEISPDKFDDKIQMAMSLNFNKIEEWLDFRTVEGNKIPKKQAAIIDEILLFCYHVSINDDSLNKPENRLIPIISTRLQDPHFAKFADKTLQKFLRNNKANLRRVEKLL